MLYIGPSAVMAVLVLLTNIIVKLLYELIIKKLKTKTKNGNKKKLNKGGKNEI
ncbi:hypothetical protein RHG06_01095 [Clostridioides difficile]|nr:hypothetical protein [Clostridioides difficile]